MPDDSVNEDKSVSDEVEISVVIPAHNEADYISLCLDALLGQDSAAGSVEAIVVANGCRDDTVRIANLHTAAFDKRHWRLKVIDIPQGSKPDALNEGDAAAKGALRMYLDADIVCDPALLGLLRAALLRPEPIYATGRLELAPCHSRITKLYGAFWKTLPFMRDGAVGAGCYAVNSAGRDRWGRFPRIIADDSFARLRFAPAERIEVHAPYHWPLAEGLAALIQVRRRQDAGMQELFEMFPELAENEGKTPLTRDYLLDALRQQPLCGLIYLAVSIAVRSRRAGTEWARAR